MGITMFLDTWASPPYQGKTHEMEERGEKEKKTEHARVSSRRHL